MMSTDKLTGLGQRLKMQALNSLIVRVFPNKAQTPLHIPQSLMGSKP